MRELFRRLVDNETVAEEVFLRLAENRARVVADNLEREGHVAEERLTVRQQEPQAREKQPTVRLSLEAM